MRASLLGKNTIWTHWLLWIREDSDRNPEVISRMLAAAAGGPQQACLWQPTLSRRNVNPHLQISFDSCKLRRREVRLFLSFIQSGPNQSKGERDPPPPLSLCLISPEGDRPVWTPPFWLTGETSGGSGQSIETRRDNLLGNLNEWRAQCRGNPEPNRATWLFCATTKAVAWSLTRTRTRTVRSSLFLSISAPGISLGLLVGLIFWTSMT